MLKACEGSGCCPGIVPSRVLGSQWLRVLCKQQWRDGREMLENSRRASTRLCLAPWRSQAPKHGLPQGRVGAALLLGVTLMCCTDLPEQWTLVSGWEFLIKLRRHKNVPFETSQEYLFSCSLICCSCGFLWCHRTCVSWKNPHWEV